MRFKGCGCAAVTRCSINGHLHSLFSAMIVEAHVWAGDTVDGHTRKLSTLATQGISTHMLGWLDQMVQAGLLHSPQQGKANGAVRLSGRLVRHLS